ncbi:MAG TPA: hypothetical protein VJT31_03505, partial [Rugosimonospora sp.]|nr:hypothetical protein [Rugosimonospora sp.]
MISGMRRTGATVTLAAAAGLMVASGTVACGRSLPVPAAAAGSRTPPASAPAGGTGTIGAGGD